MSESMNPDDKVIDIDAKKKMRKFKGFIPTVIILALLMFLGMNSFYTLESNQNAVIIRFGEAQKVETIDGPHFKIPLIDRVEKVDVKIKSMEYGYRTTTGATETTEAVYATQEQESTVIVDAANNNASIALIEIIIQYRIVDPIAYLFNVSDVEGTLRLALEDTVRQSVQSLTLDEAKTKKELIDAAIKPSLQKKMNDYNAGLEIVLVGTQNVQFLPNVETAYQQKENANQYKNGKQEDAERYYNTVIPKANAEATQLTEKASAYKAERIANANAGVAEFNALYTEYKNNPVILKEKYYIEAMTEFITNNKVVVDATNDGNIYKFYNFNENDLVKEQVTSDPTTDATLN